ncbi:unnamed protein product [Rhizoctonia solani]|uniref:Uncharacterized protein n=1 Tax=Rhizoctonia solani TaxID=456999 RepID=A0A8H3CL73_9AGAM|nr:unnamed protein product [Rhizoctonia solani]
MADPTPRLDAAQVDAARETYINQLDAMLQLQDQLDDKLALLVSGSEAAANKITEAHDTLKSRLTGTKVVSTASSVVSIAGSILMFTPAFFVGLGLVAGGAAVGAATTAVETYFFEANAAKAFTEVISNYNTSGEALNSLFQQIEDAKEKLITDLSTFLTLLDKYNVIDPTHGGLPKRPSGPDVPNPHSDPNAFSQITLKGLAAVAGAAGATAVRFSTSLGGKAATAFGGMLGEAGGKMLAKYLPVLGNLGKRLPVLSVAIDAVSIIRTWTASNETLERAQKLKTSISEDVLRLRQAVQTYHTTLEGQIGDSALQKSLRKLINLRRKPSGPPCGPDQACAMLGLLRSMPNIGMLVFVGWVGDAQDDSTQNQYQAEIMPEADVVQLSQKAMCAPVVDSAYASFPDVQVLAGDEPEDDDDTTHASMFGRGAIGAFRQKCSWTFFGKEVVYNVNGSSTDKRGGSWVRFWKWFFFFTKNGGCAPFCEIKENATAHSKPTVGGHMEKENFDNVWYILPICQGHNAPKGKHDRPVKGDNRLGWGGSLTTKDEAYAVQIPLK